MKRQKVLEGKLPGKLCISHFGFCQLKIKHVLFRTEHTESENHIGVGEPDLW